MGDQEKPIWEGNALGATVEIFVREDGWHVYEVSGGPRRELGDEWKPLVYSAAIASLVPERDELRAENEILRHERDKARSALPNDVAAFVAEVEARASKATPGPWVVEREMGIEDDPDDTIYAVESIGPLVHVQFRGDIIGDGEQADADAEFVSNARVDVTRLLAMVWALSANYSDIRKERDVVRARLAKLEAVAKEFVDAVDVYENSGDDALYDAAKEKHGALILLLDSAKGSDGGQTEAK